jgi:hypothetical protein
MTASQMMLFGGGVSAPALTGVFGGAYTSTSNGYFGRGTAINNSGNIFCLGFNTTVGIAAIYRFTAAGAGRGSVTIGPTASSSTISTGTGKPICVDSAGNHYVCFWNSVLATGFRTAYLVKYNDSGVEQWKRQLTETANNAQAVNVCLDSTAANVILTCIGQIGANTGSYVLSFTAAGALNWQRQLTGGSLTQALCCFTDASNNVFVGGQSNQTGTFRGFLVKYNSAGTIQWQRSIQDGANQQSVASGAADTAGNLYIAGSNSLMKLPAAGTTFTWQNQTPVDLLQTPNWIDVDVTSGDIVGFIFNGSNISVVSRWTTAGAIVWANDLQAQTGGNGVGLSFNRVANNIGWAGVGGSTSTAINFSLPGDGTKLGTYTENLAIGGATTYFYNPRTLVFVSATSRTNVAGGLTDAAGTLTSATATISSTVTTNVFSRAM